jgi:hypothetical protein
MTEMVTSGSMSGDRKRSDGLLGESVHESRRSHQAPPVLHATAPLLDSTVTRQKGGDPPSVTGISDDRCRIARGSQITEYHHLRRHSSHSVDQRWRFC